MDRAVMSSLIGKIESGDPLDSVGSTNIKVGQAFYLLPDNDDSPTLVGHIYQRVEFGSTMYYLLKRYEQADLKLVTDARYHKGCIVPTDNPTLVLFTLEACETFKKSATLVIYLKECIEKLEGCMDAIEYNKEVYDLLDFINAQ